MPHLAMAEQVDLTSGGTAEWSVLAVRTCSSEKSGVTPTVCRGRDGSEAFVDERGGSRSSLNRAGGCAMWVGTPRPYPHPHTARPGGRVLRQPSRRAR